MALGSLVVGGKENLPDSDTSRTVASHIAIYNLDATLQCFWEVENVPLITHLTQKEEDYYNHFKASHTRNAKVRFVLRLPFKYPAHLEHPGMKGITKACLTRPESCFDHQPEVAELYRNFMAKYLQLNHIAKVPDDQVKKLFLFSEPTCLAKKSQEVLSLTRLKRTRRECLSTRLCTWGQS